MRAKSHRCYSKIGKLHIILTSGEMIHTIKGKGNVIRRKDAARRRD